MSYAMDVERFVYGIEKSLFEKRPPIVSKLPDTDVEIEHCIFIAKNTGRDGHVWPVDQKHIRVRRIHEYVFGHSKHPLGVCTVLENILRT